MHLYLLFVWVAGFGNREKRTLEGDQEPRLSGNRLAARLSGCVEAAGKRAYIWPGWVGEIVSVLCECPVPEIYCYRSPKKRPSHRPNVSVVNLCRGNKHLGMSETGN